MTVAAMGRIPAVTAAHTRLSGGRRTGDQRFVEPATAPLISVVTVGYNAGAALRSTIDSVLGIRIDRSDIEYIVIDDGSTAATVEQVPRVFAHRAVIVQEPDFSIYDALNKGLRRCTAKHYLVFGTDDRDAIEQFRGLPEPTRYPLS